MQLPPSYNEIESTDLRLPTPRFKISPRPEEGHEALPTYTTSIFKEALFDIKWEMSSPFEKAHDRSWRTVYAILNGTALNVYRPKRTTVLGNFAPGESANSVKGFAPGHLLKSYTLQGAEIGLADDYHKRPHVVRIRAERDQVNNHKFPVFLRVCGILTCFVYLVPPRNGLSCNNDGMARIPCLSN